MRPVDKAEAVDGILRIVFWLQVALAEVCFVVWLAGLYGPRVGLAVVLLVIGGAQVVAWRVENEIRAIGREEGK